MASSSGLSHSVSSRMGLLAACSEGWPAPSTRHLAKHRAPLRTPAICCLCLRRGLPAFRCKVAAPEVQLQRRCCRKLWAQAQLAAVAAGCRGQGDVPAGETPPEQPAQHGLHLPNRPRDIVRHDGAAWTGYRARGSTPPPPLPPKGTHAHVQSDDCRPPTLTASKLLTDWRAQCGMCTVSGPS